MDQSPFSTWSSLGSMALLPAYLRDWDLSQEVVVVPGRVRVPMHTCVHLSVHVCVQAQRTQQLIVCEDGQSHTISHSVRWLCSNFLSILTPSTWFFLLFLIGCSFKGFFPLPLLQKIHWWETLESHRAPPSLAVFLHSKHEHLPPTAPKLQRSVPYCFLFTNSDVVRRAVF